MVDTVMSPSLRPGFYSAVTEVPREDLLREYREFLGRRNGEMDLTKGFSRREEWLGEAAGWEARYAGPVDAEAFNRAYVDFGAARRLSLQELALLTFVKANAGEAYGVEVVNRVRHARNPDSTQIFHQVERLLGFEETYHTRILIGATQHFGVEVKGAWKPNLQLRLLIGALAYAPGVFFHPILLASEISGVFIFQWMLKRVGEIFRDQPQVRESMEQRLTEILVDEVGHVAFNRMAVGARGMEAARRMVPGVMKGVIGTTPEYRALGLSDSEMKGVEDFNLHHLPEEVLRRSYFV